MANTLCSLSAEIQVFKYKNLFLKPTKLHRTGWKRTKWSSRREQIKEKNENSDVNFEIQAGAINW